MNVLVSTYQVNEFNALPNLNKAGLKFDAENGLKFVHSVMKPLFQLYGVQNDYGLSLLHKHFDLKEGERMTDIRGTSSPLTFEDVFPTVWGLSQDGLTLRPMEFSLETTATRPLTDSNFREFLQEFVSKVKSHGLEDILGLCTYPGDGYPGRLEFTVGRSNVNLTPEEGSKLYPEGLKRDAAWYFTDNFIKHGCKCQCRNDDNHTHGGHYTVVTETI